MTPIAILLALSMIQPAPPVPPQPPAPTEEAREVRIEKKVVRKVSGDTQTAPRAVEGPSAAEECPTRRFDVVVETGDGDEVRRTRIVLCAASDDDGSFATMLRSARERIADNPDFDAEARAEILEQIDTELASID